MKDKEAALRSQANEESEAGRQLRELRNMPELAVFLNFLNVSTILFSSWIYTEFYARYFTALYH